jgi:hypothetical protein
MTVIDFIKKYYPFLFFVVIIILSIFLFQTRSTLKHERKNNEYQQEQNDKNTKVLLDSITETFNRKLKAWEYSKDNYVVQKLSDLEKYDKDFSEELKKIKGDVIAAVQTEVQGDLGGISASSDLKVLDKETNYYGLTFKSYYSDNSFTQNLEGISKFHLMPNELNKTWKIVPDSTIFTTNTTSLNITYGFKDLDDKYQVFAVSESDKIKINDLNGGYFIDKQPPKPTAKPKKWGIGPSLNYGLNVNNTGNLNFGGSIGFGIHYNIWSW